MRAVLIGLSAFAAVLPAAASSQTVAVAGFSGSSALSSQSRVLTAGSGVSVHRGDYGQGSNPADRRERRRYNRDDGGYFIGDLRDGYDINRGWAADSYNDWWHDRPDRAFPRWMSSNGQSCQRQYWTGSGWRC
jgi:hypothetical protein